MEILLNISVIYSNSIIVYKRADYFLRGVEVMIFMDLEIFVDKIEFDIYAIENEQKLEKIRNNIILPRSFNIGSKLVYIRKILNTLIKQYNVGNAHINIENNVGIDIIEYIKIEGVVEEALSNCGVEIWR